MGHRISTSEKVCYSLAGLGQSMIFTLSSLYLMPFFIDVLGIPAGVAGTIFLIARVWDAFNDPIMGTIVDRTNTPWGKMRPYILFTALPIMILTVMTFSVPNLAATAKTVYAVIVYILWGMVYTVSDIPYNGLSSTLSSSTRERTKLLSLAKMMVAIGTGIPVLLVVPLVNLIGGGNSAVGYLVTSLIISVVGMALFTLAFFGTKERVKTTNPKNSLKDIFGAIKTNRPLLLLVLSGTLNFLRYIPQSAGLYFAQYNLGNSNYFTLLGGVIIGAAVVSILITPLLLKYITKRDLYVYTSIFGAIMSFVMYFVGYENIVVISILLFFASLPLGFFNILLPAMIADSVDYGEWKTGKRTEGVCFSGNSFIFKLTAGLSAFVTGIVLSAAGFVEGSSGVQSPAVLNSIFMLVTIFPAVGGLLCSIPLMFYRFTEDVQEIAVREIKARGGHIEQEDDNEEEESEVEAPKSGKRIVEEPSPVGTGKTDSESPEPARKKNLAGRIAEKKKTLEVRFKQLLGKRAAEKKDGDSDEKKKEKKD